MYIVRFKAISSQNVVLQREFIISINQTQLDFLPPAFLDPNINQVSMVAKYCLSEREYQNSILAFNAKHETASSFLAFELLKLY